MSKKPWTQIESWQQMKDVIKGRRKEVFDILQRQPATLFELKTLLGWEINSVSGRVTELADMGLIESVGHKVNPNSGKPGIIWRARQLCLF